MFITSNLIKKIFKIRFNDFVVVVTFWTCFFSFREAFTFWLFRVLPNLNTIQPVTDLNKQNLVWCLFKCIENSTQTTKIYYCAFICIETNKFILKYQISASLLAIVASSFSTDEIFWRMKFAIKTWFIQKLPFPSSFRCFMKIYFNCK